MGCCQRCFRVRKKNRGKEGGRQTHRQAAGPFFLPSLSEGGRFCLYRCFKDHENCFAPRFSVSKTFVISLSSYTCAWFVIINHNGDIYKMLNLDS